MIQENPVLEVRHITKKFPGVDALEDVSFSVTPGKVHALVGENGAGKSTLMKIIMGQFPPTSGEIWFNGKPANFSEPSDALKAGISMIYQEINAILDLTVAENIFLGRETMHKGKIFLNKSQQNRLTEEIIEKFGFVLDPKAKLSQLSIAKMQVVEIIKAVSLNTKLIIMDEPTSSLSSEEVNDLFRTIEKLKKQGVAIIYITHRFEEIFKLADIVTVLRDGKHIQTLGIAEVDRDRLITLMVGRDLKNIFPKLQVKPGAVVFEAKNLCSEGVFKNISFTVRRGEILGLSGLVGAGRTEIVRAIFGLDKLDSGEIYLDEKKIVISNPQKAIQHGIAMVSEDRKSVGLVLCRSVLENIALPNLDHFSRIFLLNKSKELEECNSISKKLSIKASNLNQVSEALSGGNQQKVVISKWLLSNAKVMILDEPTRGIDVGAKAEIHRLMSELAMNGMAVIMISSEMPEIVSMSDRILVIGDGKIKGEFCKNENQTNEELQEVILRCALEEK